MDIKNINCSIKYKRESIKNTLKFIREKDVQQNGSPSHLGLR